MSDERSCFNCEYLHMGRCMNVRSKFFDDECEKVRICGAWREKDDPDYRKKWCFSMKATDEYRKLLEEKKRIDARLKELQHKRALFGTVKLEMHRWASYGRESYNIMIKKHSGMINSENDRFYTIIEDFDRKHSGMINSENDRFYTIIEDFDRKHSIEKIKQIIDDLGILLEYLKEEEACEDSDK